MARPVAVLVHTARIVSNVDGTTSPASASYTPPANTLIYCIATAVRGGGAISALTLAHSGSLGTMTPGGLSALSNLNIANGGKTRTFWKDSGSSPSAGTFQLDATGQTQTNWFLFVFEITNANLTTPEKQTPIAALLNGTGPCTATLGSAVTANSLVMSVFASENGSGATITGPAASDWSLENDGVGNNADQSQTSSTCRMVMHSCTTEQQSAEYSTSSAVDMIVAIIEIAEAASGTPMDTNTIKKYTRKAINQPVRFKRALQFGGAFYGPAAAGESGAPGYVNIRRRRILDDN